LRSALARALFLCVKELTLGYRSLLWSQIKKIKNQKISTRDSQRQELVKWVDEHSDLSDKQKWQYVGIARAQLSGTLSSGKSSIF
jgi:hypothetical protein